MEFKFNTMISTMMLVAVMFAITADCDLINDIGEENYYQGVPVYTPSRECSMLGGICVQEGDCEKDQFTAKSGLCPDREMGVECCYKVIPREASCRQFKGECMKECGLAVRQPLGNDCPIDEICCILV